jgi:1,4-dihydroxy-2-naphthoate octaprenyltransferase
MTRCSVWIAAARPQTLPISCAPVLVGSACAAAAQRFQLDVAALAGAAAVLIQVGTNFANDVGDFARGADGEDRIGPPRAVSSGLITARAMRAAAALAFGLATALGAYLVTVGGWPIAAIGVAAIATGIAYTAGPWPLAYCGLGDPFVFLFFGVVGVAGTAYLQLAYVPELAWWGSVPVGALATAVLVVNNARDWLGDAHAGKRTVAVRLGIGAARREYSALVAIAFALPPALYANGRATLWICAPLLLLPWALRLTRLVHSQTGMGLAPALGGTARLLLAYAGLFSLGVVL